LTHAGGDVSLVVLELENVSKNFGGHQALKDVSFQINKSELVGLIGPNGAGKTTLINCITGVYKPSKGRVKLLGEDLTGYKPYQINRKGIARTFQIPRLFGKISVRENVLVGIRGSHVDPDELLSMVGLADKRHVPAARLSFPDRRKLEIARALSTEPQFLLLDEVMAGLTPPEMDEMVALVRQIQREKQITIMWVEHVMRAIMENTDRVIVLNQGAKLMEGLPREVAGDPRVIEIYLGEKYSFKGEGLAGNQ
jgi:branched-chain amino acid transport system ATP-binding protein